MQIGVRAAGLAVLLVGLHGCATLPDARLNRAETPVGQVQFAAASGPISKTRSEVILERLAGQADDPALLERHLAYEQAVNDGKPLVLGNKATLLLNGPDTYAAMFAAIRAAKDSINLETYIFDAGEAGGQFSQLLLERQAAGVQVNIIYDSIGSLLTPSSFFDTLRAGGVNVLEFNPVNPLSPRGRTLKINNRDHRRQLVVDGRVAFTGGVNISNTYSSAPSPGRKRAAPVGEEGWRDTHIAIEGPVVADFQKMFLETWSRQNGAALAQRNYLPPLQPRGNEIVRAIGSTPSDPRSQVFLTLMSALTHAETSIHLTIAYFAPDRQLRRALLDAARRGVDVSLVLASVSDSAPIMHLGRSYYTELLRGGVRIYQRRGPVMHAKTACIDGIWSTVGSTNLDWRSFLHNDEIDAVVLGKAFGAQMERVFAADLAASDEVTLAAWKRRPFGTKVKERLSRVIKYWM